jgi:hypothetical protein
MLDDSKEHLAWYEAFFTNTWNAAKEAVEIFPVSEISPGNYALTEFKHGIKHGDTAQVEYVKTQTQQLKNIQYDYAIAVAKATSAAEKQAIQTKYVSDMQAALVQVNQNLISEYDELSSKSNDYSQGLNTLAAAQRQVTLEYYNMQDQMRVNNLDAQKQQIQDAQEETSREIELERSKAQAVKTIREADIANYEATAKREYAEHKVTLDEETQGLLDAEKQRYNVQVEYLNKQIELAKRKPGGVPEVNNLQGQLGALKITHQTKLDDISSSGAEREMEQSRSVAEAQISNQQKLTEARVNQAKQAYTAEHNEKEISDEKFYALEKESESQLYAAQFHALADRLNITKQMGEQGKAQAAQIMGEIETLATQHETKMDQITQAGEMKRITEQRTLATNSLNYELQDSSFRLQQEQRFDTQRLSYHAVSLSKWQQQETQAVNKWYAEQLAIYNKLDIMTASVYGKDSVQYAELIRKKELLDREYQQKFIQMQDTISQKHQQTFQQMNTEFQSAFNSWMTNPNRLQHEWVGMMDSMAVSTIDNLTMMLVKHLQYELLRGTTHVATNATITASDATAAATSNSIETMSSIKSIAKSAAKAAAKAWSALADIPVVGPALGAVAAAATFAGVMALAAFEKGGVVGGQGAVPILAHAGERVLSGEQTKNFERLVNNTITNQNGSSVGSINFAPVFQSGGNTPMDMRSGFREFNRQLRLSGLVQ